MPSSSVIPGTVPDMVTVDKIYSGQASRQATIFFSPSGNGSVNISFFRIIANPNSIVRTFLASPATIVGLPSNSSYTFIVQAVNSFGTSPDSIPTALVPVSAVSDAPIIVNATSSDSSALLTVTPPANPSYVCMCIAYEFLKRYMEGIYTRGFQNETSMYKYAVI